VPGTWEVIERDGKAAGSADEAPADSASPAEIPSSAE